MKKLTVFLACLAGLLGAAAVGRFLAQHIKPRSMFERSLRDAVADDADVHDRRPGGGAVGGLVGIRRNVGAFRVDGAVVADAAGSRGRGGVFAVDVLECPRCGGRMRPLAAIQPPDVTQAILDCLELPSRAPPTAAAVPDAGEWAAGFHATLWAIRALRMPAAARGGEVRSRFGPQWAPGGRAGCRGHLNSPPTVALARVPPGVGHTGGLPDLEKTPVE